MKICELLYKCQKRYYLRKMRIQGAKPIFLLSDLIDHYMREWSKLPWQHFSSKLRKLLVEGFMKDQTCDFTWQKKERADHYFNKFQQLHDWLCRQSGEIEEDQSYRLEFKEEYLEFKPVVLKSEKHLTGILIHEQLSDEQLHLLEGVCLLQALRKQYPEHILMVKIIDLHQLDEHTITVSQENEYDLDKLIEQNRKVDTPCRQCEYAELCTTYRKCHTSVKQRMTELKLPMQYTKQQQEVITHIDGPMRICACPGTGKTTTLVGKVKHLVEIGVKPDQILVLTFSKMAANEIRKRLTIADVAVHTLNSLGYRIILQNRKILGEKKLITHLDQMIILNQVLKLMPKLDGINYDNLYGTFGLLERLLQQFNKLEKNQYDRSLEESIEQVGRIKHLYDQRLQLMGYISYDEQISIAVHLLKEYPKIKAELPFRYMLIDEVQDLSEDQIELVQLINTNNNITVFGDADQSIYKFRGADSSFLLQFPKLYPGTKDVWLDVNFRSSSEIITAAGGFIKQNQKRVPITMQPTFQTKRKVIHIQDFKINSIARLLQDVVRSGYCQGDIAILARTNRELFCVCDLLDSYNEGTDTKLLYDLPKEYVYNDYIFNLVLHLLILKESDLKDDWSLYYVLEQIGFVASKKIDDKSIYENYCEQKLIFPFDSKEASLYHIKSFIKTDVLSAFSKLHQVLELLNRPLQDAVTQICLQWIPAVIDETLMTAEVSEILQEVVCNNGLKSDMDLLAYMKSIKRYRDNQRITVQDGKERIHLSTAHDTKGSEFPVVIILATDKFEMGDVEADRNLLYVAMTRAKKALILTEESSKSLYLQEMKKDVYTMEGMNYA